MKLIFNLLKNPAIILLKILRMKTIQNNNNLALWYTVLVLKTKGYVKRKNPIYN